MPSPFPGMDPWLESPRVFPDFHNSLVAYVREALNQLLPPPYYAAIGTRVLIEGETDRIVEPDVDVLHPSNGSGFTTGDRAGGVAVAERPDTDVVVVHVPREEITEWLLEVRTTEGDESLVTSIEVLSPSNKRPGSRSREEYLAKQRELIERGVHLVEIDLLRGGAHTTAVPLRPAIEQTGGFTYHICVTRAGRPQDFEVYPIQLSRRLPTLRVPLRSGHADVQLPLQPIVDRCYDAGLYGRRLRYDTLPEPPLTPDQQAWAEQILRRLSAPSHEGA